jgi:hypothetical protein
MSHSHYSSDAVKASLATIYSSRGCDDLEKAIDTYRGRKNAVSVAHLAAATTASHSKSCNPSGGRSKRAKRTRRAKKSKRTRRNRYMLCPE